MKVRFKQLFIFCLTFTTLIISKPLICQVHIEWSTFIGGTVSNLGGILWDIEVDDQGYIYGTGAFSDGFPVTPGAYDETFQGSTSSGGGMLLAADVVVFKLSPDGSQIIWATYLGGSGADCGKSIAVNNLGEVYVTGYTGSLNFPVTQGAFDMTFNDMTINVYDVFVAKLSPNGDSLLYSTYYGGPGDNYAESIDIDSQGNAYIGGYTNSDNIPVTSGAFDTTYAGAQGFSDAFIFKLDPTGSSLIYSTYIGGDESETVNSLKVSPNGAVYATGEVNSWDFPTTIGSYNQFKNGPSADAYALKLNPAGSALNYCTYLGGSSGDYGESITADAGGNVYITGRTYSSSFPVTTNAYDYFYNNNADVFVSKISPQGNVLVYSTFLGGTEDDIGSSIEINDNDEIFVSGISKSSDFPYTNCSLDSTYNGGGTSYWGGDIFVSKFNTAGNTLQYSTFIGGIEDEFIPDIELIEDSCLMDLVCSGSTGSINFPVSAGAFQTTKSNATNDFAVFKLSQEINPGFEAIGTFCSGDTLNFIDTTDFCGVWKKPSVWSWDFGNGQSSNLHNPSNTYFSGGGYTVVFKAGSCPADTISAVLTINEVNIDIGNDTMICQNDTIMLDGGNDASNWQWSTGDTTQIINIVNQGIYWVTGYEGSCIGSDTIEIFSFQPSLELGNDTLLCTGDTLILNASSPFSSYIWQDGSTGPTYEVTDQGIYSVIVMNICNYSLNDQIEVNFDECNCRLFIPNTFTPNQNNLNDLFFPQSNCPLKSYHLYIFNRWGELLYDTRELTKGWDGYFNGNLLPEGVYIYQIDYQIDHPLHFKGIERINGSILLLR